MIATPEQTATQPRWLEPARASEPSSRVERISGVYLISITFRGTDLHFDPRSSGPATEGEGECVKEIAGTLRIGDQEFLIEFEDDLLYLRHPTWSLVGSGESLPEAETDLRVEAQELRDALLQIPASKLAPETRHLLDYLLSSL